MLDGLSIHWRETVPEWELLKTVRREFEALQQAVRGIGACRVTLQRLAVASPTGERFRVGVELSVKASQAPVTGVFRHGDAAIALRNAFAVVYQQMLPSASVA